MKLIRYVVLSAFLALQALPSSGQAQEVKVGVAFPDTGPYAFLGVQVRKGFNLGMDEFNSSNTSSLKIVPVIQDQTGDKTKVIALMSQFAVREKVAMILGPIGTAEALAAAPVVNELEVPTYTTAVSEDVLKAGKWSFKMWQDPKVVMDPVSDYIIQSGVKTLVMAYMRDGDSYIAFKNLVRDRVTKAGVKVLSEEPLMSSDTDFSALGTKLVNMQPDAVYLGGLPEISANIAVQAHRLGLSENVRLFGIGTLSTPTFARIGGADIEGTVIPTDYFYETPSPLNVKFVAAYRQKYNETPDLFAALGYQYVLITINALRNAGPTPTRESIRAALAGTKNLASVLGAGTYTLDDNRLPSYGATLVRYHDGKLVAVTDRK